MSPLTPQQDQVIALLMQGAKAFEAAQQVGVHRNTVSNWRRSCPEFQHAFADAQLEQSTYYRAQIANLGDSAIRELKAILKEPSSSLTLRAVVVILDRIIKPVPPPPLLPPIPEYQAESHQAPPGAPGTTDAPTPSEASGNPAGQPLETGPLAGKPEILHNRAQPCPISLNSARRLPLHPVGYRGHRTQGGPGRRTGCLPRRRRPKAATRKARRAGDRQSAPSWRTAVLRRKPSVSGS